MKRVVLDVKFAVVQSVDKISREQLLKMGSCCALGCSNCPYTKPRVKGNVKLTNDDINNK